MSREDEEEEEEEEGLSEGPDFRYFGLKPDTYFIISGKSLHSASFLFILLQFSPDGMLLTPTA